MADGASSLKEWYEQQDMKSPGLAQIVSRDFKVGNRVDVWSEKEKEWVVGTIIAKKQKGSKFDIIYDRGDEDNDVDPLFIRLEVPSVLTDRNEKHKLERYEPRSRRQVEILRDENQDLIIKYNKLKESLKTCEETMKFLTKENIKLKQEKESYIRLIDELSSAQRTSIKAGTRKNKRIKNVSKYSTTSKRNDSRR